MKYDRLGLIDRLVERGQRQRLPEQLAQPRRLAVLFSHCAHGFRSRACLAEAARPRRPDLIADADPQHRQPLAPAERVPRQHAGEQVQRRRQRRQRQHAVMAARDRSSAPSGRSASARDRRRRCARGTRACRRSTPSGCAGRCRRARRLRDRVNAVARPPSPGRASSTSTRAPASASAVAALNPAKPPPMTIASDSSCTSGAPVKPIADSCDIAQICSAIRARASFGTRTRSVNTS